VSLTPTKVPAPTRSEEVDRRSPPAARRVWPWALRHRTELLTYGLTQAVLLFWWVAFNPALFGYDSLDYIWEATTSHWASHHSVAYTALVWLSLQLTGGFGALTLLQTVGLAAALAYLVGGLRRLGASAVWAMVAAVVVCALPSVGPFMIFVWKDTAFVIAEVFVAGVLTRIVFHRRAGEQRTVPVRLVLLLAGGFSLVALFRQNGFEIAIVAGLIAAAFLRGGRIRVLAAGAAGCVVGLAANLVVYPAFGVRNEFANLSSETVFHDIAVVYAASPRSFTATETALMARVASLDHWRSTGDCYAATDALYGGGFNLSRANGLKDQFGDVWLRLVKRVPADILEARVCRASLGWRVFVSGDRGHVRRHYVTDDLSRLLSWRNKTGRPIAGTPFAGAIHYAPLSEPAHAVATWSARLSQAPTFEALLWRGVTWAYLAYVALVLVARRRRDWGVLAIAAIVAANQLSVLLHNPSQSPRYMLGPLIIGMVVTTVLIRPRRGGVSTVRDDAIT
jgi:hypothetical protein